MTLTLLRRLTLAGALCASMLAACTTQAPESPQAAAPAPATQAAPATTSVAPPPDAPEWHYEGTAGPANWGTLSPKFSACSQGRAQSPIDIARTAPVSMPELKMNFRPAELRIAHREHTADAINNGHTIQVNYSEGDTLSVGDAAYQLLQYHFHAPSEHTVKGRHSPMEMHMVHKAADGKLAVVGVFIEEGQHNAAFDPVWSNLPKEKGLESHFPSVKVNVDDLLPAARTSYRYDGSLTTPPCSEGVTWIVMTTPIQLAGGQIGQFTALVNKNNRPVQPLNGRRVATDSVAEKTSR
jgi:carbonic anhydrase